jgi:Phage tail lysozyme
MAKGPRKIDQLTEADLAQLGPAARKQIEAQIQAANAITDAAKQIEEATKKTEEIQKKQEEPEKSGYFKKKAVDLGSNIFDKMFPNLAKVLKFVSDTVDKNDKSDSEKKEERRQDKARQTGSLEVALEAFTDRQEITNEKLSEMIDNEKEMISILKHMNGGAAALSIPNIPSIPNVSEAGGKTGLNLENTYGKFGNIAKAGSIAAMTMESINELSDTINSQYQQKLEETIKEFGPDNVKNAYRTMILPHEFFLSDQWKADPKYFVKSFMDQVKAGQKPEVGALDTFYHKSETYDFQKKQYEEERQQQEQLDKQIEQNQGSGADQPWYNRWFGIGGSSQVSGSSVSPGDMAGIKPVGGTGSSVSPGDMAGIKPVGGTGSAAEAINFFVSKGWTLEQAAGIVGNLQAESGKNLKIDSVGDGGQAYGIAQWHPDRQANFKKTFGKDIREANFQEQLAFVDWELKNTEIRAGNQLRQAKTAEEAAKFVDATYERSSGAARGQRMANAAALMSGKDSNTQVASGGNSTAAALTPAQSKVLSGAVMASASNMRAIKESAPQAITVNQNLASGSGPAIGGGGDKLSGTTYRHDNAGDVAPPDKVLSQLFGVGAGHA